MRSKILNFFIRLLLMGGFPNGKTNAITCFFFFFFSCSLCNGVFFKRGFGLKVKRVEGHMARRGAGDMQEPRVAGVQGRAPREVPAGAERSGRQRLVPDMRPSPRDGHARVAPLR